MGLFCVLMWNLYAETSLAEGGDQTVWEKLAALEISSGGRLGVVMLDAGGDTDAAYRGAERFPMCSTFKMMLAEAILKRSTMEPDLMERRITFTKDDLVSYETSIRAGVPADWIAGDKTGSGGYGTTNDIAVLWPAEGQPLIIAVYFTQKAQDTPSRRDVIAAATRLIVAYWQTRKP